MNSRLILVLLLGFSSCLAPAQKVGPLQKAQRRAMRMKQAGLNAPLLQRIMQAQGGLRFSGARMVEFRQGADLRSHEELILRDGPRVRITFPEGSPFAGQVIVENRKQRLQYFPDKNEIRVLPARLEDAMDRFGNLVRQVRQNGFQFRVAAGGDVAGIHTQSISFTDAKGNIVQRLWADPNTGMVLKRELYDAVGAKAGAFEYRQINYRPNLSDGDFDIRRKGARLVTMDDQLLEVAKSLSMRPYRIPAGEPYELQNVRAIRLRKMGVLHELYAGTGKRISLYQCHMPLDRMKAKRLAGERLNVVSFSVRGSNFMLVGDADQGELERLSRLIGR